jgi:hypothetical protein
MIWKFLDELIDIWTLGVFKGGKGFSGWKKNFSPKKYKPRVNYTPRVNSFVSNNRFWKIGGWFWSWLKGLKDSLAKTQKELLDLEELKKSLNLSQYRNLHF